MIKHSNINNIQNNSDNMDNTEYKNKLEKTQEILLEDKGEE